MDHINKVCQILFLMEKVFHLEMIILQYGSTLRIPQFGLQVPRPHFPGLTPFCSDRPAFSEPSGCSAVSRGALSLLLKLVLRNPCQSLISILIISPIQMSSWDGNSSFYTALLAISLG